MLTILTFLPAATVLALLVIARTNQKAIRLAALFGSLATLGFGLALLASFDPGAPGYQLVETLKWVPALGIEYRVGIDGISLFLVVLTAVLTPIAILCSWQSVEKRVLEFHIALLLLETGMIGVFVALDLVLFYVFWEVMLIPMYLLIGVWGSAQRIRAAIKFFLYTMAGSLLMFLAIVYLYVHLSQAGPPDLHVFRVDELPAALRAAPLAPAVAMVLFLAFALSFAIKVPLFPFHTWLPDAHTEAPTAGSVILAGVLLKMGTYGFLRFAIPFFPEAAQAAAPWFSALAVIGILFGAAMCLVQDDIKRLIAYSSVSHLGFVMLGIFAFNLRGVVGGILQMVNHGLSTGALFLLVGLLYERRHSRKVADYGGLATPVPMLATVFVITMLSSIGLPFLNGFVGEFLILQGTFEAGPALSALGALGIVLGAVYMLALTKKVFFGPVAHAENAALADLSAREVSFLVPLVVLMVAIGLCSPWFTGRIEPSVTGWLETTFAGMR